VRKMHPDRAVLTGDGDEDRWQRASPISKVPLLQGRSDRVLIGGVGSQRPQHVGDDVTRDDDMLTVLAVVLGGDSVGVGEFMQIERIGQEVFGHADHPRLSPHISGTQPNQG